MILIHRTEAFEKWAPFAARCMLGINFLFSAMGKFPGSENFNMEVASSSQAGLPFPVLMVTLAFILEAVASIMLIIGWHARIAAFLLSIFVLLIGLTFVKSFADQMQLIIFFSCLQLIAGLTYIAVYGAKSVAIRKD
jgi:putative oxidoreductase